MGSIIKLHVHVVRARITAPSCEPKTNTGAMLAKMQCHSRLLAAARSKHIPAAQPHLSYEAMDTG